LGTEKWSAGPAVGAVSQRGSLTWGVVANHLWSFAGDDRRADVSRSSVQPFMAYIVKGVGTFGLGCDATADWKARAGQHWRVPMNAGLTRIFRLRPFPLALGGSAGYFVETPAVGPQWKLRLTTTILLPPVW
jgi:hypothetical protein